MNPVTSNPIHLLHARRDVLVQDQVPSRTVARPVMIPVQIQLPPTRAEALKMLK